MSEFTITSARVVASDSVHDRGWLHASGGKIVDLGPGDPPHGPVGENIDAHGQTLLPGFIDLHAHGAMGNEAMDASPDALDAMAQYYATHGVTSFLATTWTDSRQRIEDALASIKEALGPRPRGAVLLGAHLEGPYLNPEKCGAQNVDYIRRADREEATTFLDMDVIRLLALAPEYDENRWLIETCVERGVTVSLAHTGATYDQTVAAIDAGVTHATHTFNAMVGLHHRQPGTVGAVLTTPGVRCELIADNIHVHPAVMNILWRMTGPKRLVLITDAIRAAGLADGDYTVDERIVYVRDGVARLEDGALAGSRLTMDMALYNLCAATGEDITAVWPCASLTPAQAIGVDDVKGSLAPGKDADLVLMDDDLNVRRTIVGGETVYQG